MITSIITSLGIVALSVAMIILIRHDLHTDESIERLEQLVDKKASDLDLQAVKSRLTQEIAEACSTSLEINETIRKLNRITMSLKKLEEKTEQDHKDLVDIRERYVLWREPAITNYGVPWASKIKCKEDE